MTRTYTRKSTNASPVMSELDGWFRHPAGFMIGISDKATAATSDLRGGVTLTDIAKTLFAQE